MKDDLSILLFILIAMVGCKKSQNATNSKIVTCNATQSSGIAYNGSTMPDLNAMPGDTINFQSVVLVSGPGGYYNTQPNDLTGCAILWNFGDGNTSTALSPNHVYGSSGTYTVHLTLNDDSTNIISSSIYIGPVPIYTQAIVGTWRWKRFHVVTSGVTAISDTTISDTTFTVNIVNEDTISIGSIYLQYVPGFSKGGSYQYSGVGGDPICAVIFNHITNKIQYIVDYGWWMTDTFESI